LLSFGLKINLKNSLSLLDNAKVAIMLHTTKCFGNFFAIFSEKQKAADASRASGS